MEFIASIRLVSSVETKDMHRWKRVIKPVKHRSVKQAWQKKRAPVTAVSAQYVVHNLRTLTFGFLCGFLCIYTHRMSGLDTSQQDTAGCSVHYPTSQKHQEKKRMGKSFSPSFSLLLRIFMVCLGFFVLM